MINRSQCICGVFKFEMLYLQEETGKCGVKKQNYFWLFKGAKKSVYSLTAITAMGKEGGTIGEETLCTACYWQGLLVSTSTSPALSTGIRGSKQKKPWSWATTLSNPRSPSRTKTRLHSCFIHVSGACPSRPNRDPIRGWRIASRTPQLWGQLDWSLRVD